ncbi:metalloregulator ArsR/SmtB family transcription factor [Halorubrum sp. AD140]|uniref:ArsR/SmtB family transcription factor n=1 Tax=Halorubrum sp. AD140 TaxID=3050073 RepID=UPI002ACC5A12|nr:metalloregulator ArsR/SmtB family transcription factor [Halorubrum sp. AD140]MDZ5810036.1 metalloregulator ArsR/SmtB family transcription factor [Halorubrum sp. AD140]
MTEGLSDVEREEAATVRRGCCASVDHGVSPRGVDADVETLAALGNETRYEALRLVAATEGGTCGCEIEPALDVSQGAVSQALSRLHDAGLVTRRKEGRWRYYDATERALRLLDVLDETRSSDEVEAGAQS